MSVPVANTVTPPTRVPITNRLASIGRSSPETSADQPDRTVRKRAAALAASCGRSVLAKKEPLATRLRDISQGRRIVTTTLPLRFVTIAGFSAWLHPQSVGIPATEPPRSCLKSSLSSVLGAHEAKLVRDRCPSSCPFRATKGGNRRRAAAQGEGRKSSDSTRHAAQTGSVQHMAAKG